MPYTVRKYPDSVYPGEVDSECPEARAAIDALLAVLREQGPSPAAYDFKSLGQPKGGLWQINLKVEKRQVRLLYAPYGHDIVLFRIHKKSSPQEQKRAYDLAQERKRNYEKAKAESERKSHGRSGTPHRS